MNYVSSYVQQALNGDWLVLQGGQQDRLLGVAKTKEEARRLQVKLDKEAA